MELEHVTDEMFIAAMEQAVTERGPDFVYPKGEPGWTYGSGHTSPDCRYVRNDVAEPACIMGVALFKCGVPLNVLRAREGDGIWHVLQSSGVSVLVQYAADKAQRVQDEGGTWGGVLSAFRHMHETRSR